MVAKKRKTLTRKPNSAVKRIQRDAAMMQLTTRVLQAAENESSFSRAILDELVKIRKLVEIALVRIGPRKAKTHRRAIK